jgi:hypothetical protein
MYYFLLSFFLLAPTVVFGQYKPLIELNLGVGSTSKDVTFSDYIDYLYVTSISIAAMIAVVKIIIAGVKYMLTDVISGKGEAKSDIKGALLGLLLILGAVIILEVINPELTKNSVEIRKVNVTPPTNTARPSVGINSGERTTTPPDNRGTVVSPTPETSTTNPSKTTSLKFTGLSGRPVKREIVSTNSTFNTVLYTYDVTHLNTGIPADQEKKESEQRLFTQTCTKATGSANAKTNTKGVNIAFTCRVSERK